MGNKNLIITIEREYGSGGRIVGKKLAEEKTPAEDKKTPDADQAGEETKKDTQRSRGPW